MRLTTLFLRLQSRTALLSATLMACLSNAAPTAAQPGDGGAIRVMLLTGQSSIYHDWEKSSRVIEEILDEGLRASMGRLRRDCHGLRRRGMAGGDEGRVR
jgi:hypothetical protein